MKKIPSSEITPEHVYLSRRKFLKAMGVLGLQGALLSACGRHLAAPPPPTAGPTPSPPPALPPRSAEHDELGAEITPLESAFNYCNYYEFTTNKEAVAAAASDFPTDPWQVEVGGLVEQPHTFDLDDLFRFEQEERVYRMRCVEGYSMVIPWNGFPLARLLREVQPTSRARYVRFQTLYDPEEMPGQNNLTFPWPYVEGLSLPEALHDLTLLATGCYGRAMPAQKGGPLRLVVPWKYGFKSIKAIVKIELVEEQPVSLWMAVNAREYGFWANVNPEVPHPRWSQATERRIGEPGRRETLLFNGYTEEVAHLYPNLDDRDWYY